MFRTSSVLKFISALYVTQCYTRLCLGLRAVMFVTLGKVVLIFKNVDKNRKNAHSIDSY